MRNIAENVGLYRLQFSVDQTLKESASYNVRLSERCRVQTRPVHPDSYHLFT